MRPVIQRLSAAGYSPWVPLNRLQSAFTVGLSVTLSSGASLTFSVYYSLDDPNDPVNLTQNFTLSRSTTVLSVTKVAHGLSVGDWVKLWGNGGAPLDGEFATVAAITSADIFTVTVANSGLTAGNGVGWLQTMRAQPITALAAKTATTSAGLLVPCTAVRFGITTYASGTADFSVIQPRG